MLLLHEHLDAHSRAHPDGHAWHFAGVASTWAEVRDRVGRLAANLVRLGLKPGDRVAVYAENSGEIAELFVALGAVGLVSVPVNPRSVRSDIDFICADVGARALFVTAALASKLGVQEGFSPAVPLVVGVGQGHGCPVDFAELLQEAPPIDFLTDASAIRAIKYTSGTTGVAKGCISTHGQFLQSIGVYLETVPFRPDDRALLALPMTAGVGMYLLAAYVMAGIPTVIHSRFEAPRFLQDLAAYGVTRFYGMPTMLGALARAQEAQPHDVRSLRLAGYGGSPAAIHLVRQAASVLNCGLYQTFGASEAGGFITYLEPQQHARVIAGGRGTQSVFGSEVVPCGVAARGVQLRIVDDQGRDTPTGVPGEMWVRSASLMSGYWNRPDQSAEALRHGWLLSGDMAVRDEEGFVSVVDRKRDMIISGGYNVYSSEVEGTLQRHPAVAEVAVVGVPDPYWGETVVAFVTPAPGDSLDEAAILALAEKELAGYKRPRAIFPMAALPKTTTGKIRKNELREQALPLWQARHGLLRSAATPAAIESLMNIQQEPAK
jgi:acyl-CoA synthetase (AMP-forming)/AMP-acid ligase II